jgi:hypothetical protein
MGLSKLGKPFPGDTVWIFQGANIGKQLLKVS